MIRHSSLPKLAQCPRYESQAVAGPAAERGTRMDAAFRQYIQTETLPEMDEAEAEAIKWAALTLRSMSGGEKIEVREELCKVSTPGIEHIGTADALVLGKSMHADLKSGQIRNCMEQMAAYALGFMEATFSSEWTAHLLFCDQRQVVTHTFTYAEAECIVGDVLSEVKDPNAKPALCDYCGWCAKQDTCEARTAPAASALELVNSSELEFRFTCILEDPAQLGAFLSSCKVLEDYQDKAKEKAREYIEAGTSVDGWKITAGRKSKVVFPDDIGRHIKELGFGSILDACGPMSESKFRKIWEAKAPDKPFPDSIVRELPQAKPTLKKA